LMSGLPFPALSFFSCPSWGSRKPPSSAPLEGLTPEGLWSADFAPFPSLFFPPPPRVPPHSPFLLSSVFSCAASLFEKLQSAHSRCPCRVCRSGVRSHRAPPPSLYFPKATLNRKVPPAFSAMIDRNLPCKVFFFEVMLPSFPPFLLPIGAPLSF